MESKELSDEPFSVPLLATPTKGKKRALLQETSPCSLLHVPCSPGYLKKKTEKNALKSPSVQSPSGDFVARRLDTSTSPSSSTIKLTAKKRKKSLEILNLGLSCLLTSLRIRNCQNRLLSIRPSI